MFVPIAPISLRKGSSLIAPRKNGPGLRRIAETSGVST